MTTLIVGLVLFLGVHSLSIINEPLRNRLNASMGEGAFKGLYSVVSLVGLVLIVWGYGAARMDPTVIYVPPGWLKHVSFLLLVPVFPLLFATYFPGKIKEKLGHPMLAAVKLWALAHLLANGMLHDILLFGAFLVWAIVAFAKLRRRDRAQGVTYAPATLKGDVITLVVGVLAWALFAFWLHGALIGVRPFG